jgi:N-acetylmuramoyl-L-alanine amidase
VIIDPGHGGSDTGSRTKIGQEEKDQALQIAQQIKKLLAIEEGMDVYLTRDTDRYMTAAERINRANDLGGHVYLSIHFNWSPSQRSRGFRIYVNSDQIRLGKSSGLGSEMFSRGKSRASENYQTGRFLPQSKSLAEEVEKRLKNMDLVGEPYKEAFLAHMDDLLMPGALVEVLYFSNPKDRSILSKPDFINSVSRAFCDSIIALRDILADENAL